MGRIIKYIIGWILLAIAVILPYRFRVAYGDRLGRLINAFYRTYIRLLRWFFRKLET